MPCAADPTCAFPRDTTAHKCSKCSEDVHRTCSRKIAGTRDSTGFDDWVFFCSEKCSGALRNGAGPSNAAAADSDENGKSDSVFTPRTPGGSAAKVSEGRVKKVTPRAVVANREPSNATHYRRASQFRREHMRTYGVEVQERDSDTGVVTLVRCRFCVTFGRSTKEPAKPAAGATPNRQRAPLSTTKSFKHPFRTDKFVSHMREQHGALWAEYQNLDAKAKDAFFSRETALSPAVPSPPRNQASRALETPTRANPARAKGAAPMSSLARYESSPESMFMVGNNDPSAEIQPAAETVESSYVALRQSIQDREALIGVIGLGYVGLPLVRTFHSAGCRVLGYDTDLTKVKSLEKGESYIRHISSSSVAELAESPRFSASSSFKDLMECAVVVICLPTPVGPHNEPDMSYVTSTVRGIADILHRGVLVVVESTTYPGATDTDMVNILNRASPLLKVGRDFFVAYSPEREDPGNAEFSTTNIPKLVGGVDDTSGSLAKLLYERGGFTRVERVSSARVAECAKLLENSYRAVNIALVNELKGVFRAMNVDIWEVLEAASTKPFGFSRFDPGPGIGGHCIPVDPFYLAWKARETGKECNFIALAAEVNAGMPATVVSRVQCALNDALKPVRGSKVLLLGLAYKANVDDMRCAPALEIWAGLVGLGAVIFYHDPYVPVVCATRRHPSLTGTRSVLFTLDAMKSSDYDAVVVVTHHDCFGEYAPLVGFTGPVVDTRNRVPPRSGLTVVSA